MAIQTLLSGRDPGQIGTALGTGLSGLLEGLAQAKLQQFQRAQQVQDLQNISPLITPQIAQSLIRTPQNLQGVFLKDILAAPSQEANAQLVSQYLGLQPSQSPLSMMGQQPQLETQTAAPSAGMQALSGLGQQEVQPVLPQPQAKIPPKLTSQQTAQLLNLGQSQRKEQQKERLAGEARTYDVLKDIVPKKQQSDLMLQKINRAQELVQKETLPNPQLYGIIDSFLSPYGINTEALFGADAEEFVSLGKQFLAGGFRDIFPRATEMQTREYLKSFARLSNTKEGQERILKSMGYAERAKNAFLDAKIDIIEKNGGIAPNNIDLLAYRESEKRKDQLFNKINQTLDIPKEAEQKEAQQESLPQEEKQQPPSSTGKPFDLDRYVARTAARGLEGGIGTVGSLASLAASVGSLTKKTITGKESEFLNKVQDFIPSSETVRKYLTGPKGIIGRNLPEGYLEPQSTFDKLSDDFIETFAGLAVPIPGIGAVGMQKAALLAGIGTGSKGLTQAFGASPAVQEGVKLGAMLATSIFGAKGARKAASDMYDTAKNELEKISSKKIKVNGLNKTINSIKNKLSSGASTPSKEKALKFLEDVGTKQSLGRIISKRIKPGEKLALQDVYQLTRDINQMVFKESDKDVARAAKDYLSPLKTPLLNSIKDVKDKYPKFAHNFLTANEIWSTISTDNIVSEFIAKAFRASPKITKAITNPATAMLLGIGGSALGIPFAGKIGKAVTLSAGYKMFKDAIQSREIRKLYMQTITAAVRNNTSQFARSIRQLDKELARKNIGA